jgi:hypothetical protein
VKAVILALFLLVLAAPAAAQEPLRLEPYRDGIGYLGLRVTGPAGATVTVGETTGGTAAPLGQVALAAGRADLRRAVRWRCSPRHRTFHAEAQTATGAVLTAGAARTTPRCPTRLHLHVRPSHPRAGRPARSDVRGRGALLRRLIRACARCARAGSPGSSTHVPLPL